MKENVYLKLGEMVAEALASLPRCRVRADALKIALFLAHLAPRGPDGFAFATTIFDHSRFRQWCGDLDSNGKPWTRSRVRSCRAALAHPLVGFLTQLNPDTVCYYDAATRSFKDTPNRYLMGASFGAVLAPPAPSPTSCDAEDDASIPERGPVLTATIRELRFQNIASLVVAVKRQVILGRVRSDIIRQRAAIREAQRMQFRLPGIASFTGIAMPPLSKAIQDQQRRRYG